MALPTAHLVFNPVSGRRDAAADLAALREGLAPHVALVVRETTPTEDGAGLAREAVDAGADLVLVAGGDGTVSAVCGALVGTEVPVVVVPRGTANAFAVSLLGERARRDPVAVAVAAVRDGQVRRVDAARVDDRVMVQLAGLGLEAAVIADADRGDKDALGPFAYLFGGVRQLRAQRPFRARLEADGETRRLSAIAVVVANAAPETSLLAQGAGPPIPDDGLLDVTVVAPFEGGVDALGALAELAAAALVDTPTGERVAHLRARRVRVEAEPPQPVAVDGEVGEAGPLDVVCLPGALALQVPVEPAHVPPEAPDPTPTRRPAGALAGPYLGVATALVAAALLVGGAAWILAWPAAALVLVSVGYLGAGPGVLGKRADGSRNPLLGWIGWPYRALAAMRWRARRSSPEPPWHRVTGSLYLGRRPRRGELPGDVDVVVDLTAELDRLAGADVAYLCVPSLDFDVPREADLRAMLDAVDDERVVYVHCAAGHGRSAMAAAAILVRRGEARDVDDAYARLRSARPTVRKNRWQARLARRVVGEGPGAPAAS